MGDRPNIWSDDWERDMGHGGFALRGTRVATAAGAEHLGAGVFELDPGKKNLPYHAHHGIEEVIVVLRGRPTLRTPDGERLLEEGEVVACPRGRAGAHQLINRTDSTVRFMIISERGHVDLVEYPDSGKISAQGGGQWGTPEAVAYMLSTENQLGYFDGEPD